MPTDDEILVRVQERATAIRRRQRLMMAGCATFAMAILLGGVAVAGSGRSSDDPARTFEPVGGSATEPAPTTAEGDGATCPDPLTASDPGSATADPDGSPTVPTDGSGSEVTSVPPTSTDSLPARGDPAGEPPTESSIPPDDPSAATASAVEASSTACPLQVTVVAGHRSGSTVVDLTVTATAEPLYDAHGFVVWDTAEPVQVDLGALERSPGSCDPGADPEEPVQGAFQATHTYPTGGDKELTVSFWARRCGGPVHQVEVTVVVPL